MANFVRRCECGLLVRLKSLTDEATCGSCGALVVVQKNKHVSGSNFDREEEPVTIAPVVD